MPTYNYKCEIKCQRDANVRNKALCNAKCTSDALKYIVKVLETEYNKCDKTPNAIKCRKRLLPLIKEYRIKRNKSINRLSIVVKKARSKGEF